jgi:SAM-dependent methyltransferase
MTDKTRTRDQLLKEINAELPVGVDWRQGALDFVAAWSANVGADKARRIQLTTPLRPADKNLRWSLAETVQYLYNYTNTLDILDLEPDSSILDVACGGGWFSHFLTRCGFRAFGIDISAEFIAFAQQRMRDDPYLSNDPAEMFMTHDIERGPLPSTAEASFDAAVLESCLHHFYDPISALSNISRALKPTGIAVIIEGENRIGPINVEWIEEMRIYRALERPYPRALLEEILIMSGFPAFEFVGQVNGWFSPSSPEASDMNRYFQASLLGRNHVIAAKSTDALRRIFPYKRPGDEKLRFGRGFHAEHDGWRWADPQADIEILSGGPLTLRLLGHGPVLTSPQRVNAFSRRHGACGQTTLSADATSADLKLTPEAGDTITLCSDFAFSPAWQGESDPRLLSFALAVS